MQRSIARRLSMVAIGALVGISAITGGAPRSAAQDGARQPAFACETGERVVRNARRLGAVAGALQAQRPIRILAIGSSSTEGVGSSGSAQTYPAQLQNVLQRRWARTAVTVVNAGIGGETATRTLERLDETLRAQDFDLVIWQVGTNDAVRGGDVAGFRAVLDQGIHIIQQARVDLVILDQQFYPGIANIAQYERFVSIVAEAAEAGDVPLFSRYRLMQGWSARGESELRATLAPDAFHMNDVGYACLGRMLAVDLADMARMGPALAGQR